MNRKTIEENYPDTPLGPQVRPLEETLSVFTVLKEHFFPELCAGCDGYVDAPSRYCPACQAYNEHTGHF